MTHAARITRKVLATLCSTALVASTCLPAAAWAEGAGSTPTSSSARVFTQDGITYQVTGAETARVGTGETFDTAVDLSVTGANVTIPTAVSDGTTTYTVTAVGAYAFYNLPTLTSVTLPASVARLENYAFAFCGTMDDANTPVTYGGLREVVIPQDTSLDFIGSHCFYRDYALRAFTIPASVTSISTASFASCFSFDRLEFGEGSQISSISASAFELEWQSGQVKPSSWTSSSQTVTSIDWTSVSTLEADVKASKKYGGLTSVVLPPSVTDIGNYAFCNQRCLASVDFGSDDITQIQDWAFAFCTSLTEFSVPSAGMKQSEAVGYLYAYGQYSFACCVNLETFTFAGLIKAPASRWNELRMFDGCVNLSKVVYCVNKVIPTSDWGKDGAAPSGESLEYGFNSSDPTLYYRVTFYDSRPQAEDSKDEDTGTTLGTAVLREGTTLSTIHEGMASTDDKGEVVLRGAVPALPSGYDAWGFEKGTASSALDEPLYAYPVNSTDLAFASVNLSNTAYWHTGSDCTPTPTVTNAAGRPLTEGTDYTLSWEREHDEKWGATNDLSSVGTIRVTATAANGSGYTGSASATYQIAYLEEGTTLTYEGITYLVIKNQTAQEPAEVQVGDGVNPAVDQKSSGAISLPGSITLEDSTNPVIVTAVGAYAFGSSDASAACDAITEVTLPSTLVSIGNYAFSNMTSLRSISFPATLQTIGNEAFSYDTALASVAFAGSSIAEIGVKAFQSCSSLRTISLPAVTGSLQGLAFANCVMLSQVTFTGNVNAASASQFSGCNRLATVIFNGTEWGYGFGSGTTIYYNVTFYKANGSTVLGTAAIKKGTTLSAINTSLPASSLASGSVPALPAGATSWTFSGISGATLASAARAVATTAGGTAGATYTAGSKTTKARYKVTSNAKSTVTYVACQSTSKKSAIVPKTVTINGKAYKVTKVAAGAFKGVAAKAITVKSLHITSLKKAFTKAKATKVTIKSKKVTSFKKAFTGSKVKTVKVPKAQKKAYKKLLTKAKCGTKVTVR